MESSNWGVNLWLVLRVSERFLNDAKKLEESQLVGERNSVVASAQRLINLICLLPLRCFYLLFPSRPLEFVAKVGQTV